MKAKKSFTKKDKKKRRSTRKKRDRTLERICDKSILDTLNYRAVFDSGASYFQLGTFLLNDTDKKVDFKTFDSRVKNLKRGRKIKGTKQVMYTTRGKPVSWDLRAKHSTKHLRNATFAFELLKKIKWIKMLAVTGSVAAYGAQKKDDIDIFIITERHRVWLTRAFVFLLLKAIGMYRSRNNSSGKLCPNIYVSEDRLAWDLGRRNVYTAHEILMMHPIINKDNTYFKFLKRNDWVFDYFRGYEVWLPERIKRSKTKYESTLVDKLEIIAMFLQLWYMRKKKTCEITTRNLIHFNKEDHTDRVLESFNA